MTDQVGSEFIEHLQKVFATQGFMQLIGAQVVAVSPGQAALAVQFRDELDQHNGFFHGGVVGALADNACGAAAATLMPAGYAPLTVEYKINLLAPARGDRLEARARVLKPGRTLTVCTADVVVAREGEEALCATALATMMAAVVPAQKP